jgi:NAD(P)-dependent dehydrogenase (short-subunit alcohol dehydrogenase family)
MADMNTWTSELTDAGASQPVAVITGGSRGLGLATAQALTGRGWAVALDARRTDDLESALRTLPAGTFVGVPGDITDPDHRTHLVDAARALGEVTLVVANASRLGPSPQPPLATYPIRELRSVFETNLIAPLALIQLLLPDLTARNGTVITISSDAAVEGYAGWGGYGSSKAALDQLTAILAAEHPELAVHAFDPGDMRTELHQQAFPGEDISDRPEPDSVVPALLRLLDSDPEGVRHRASELLTSAGAR